MQKLSGATQLTIGLMLGLVVGLGLVGAANQPRPATTTTSTTVSMRTVTVTEPVYEFYAPRSSGVECEMTNTSTLCITTTPPQRAVVSGNGTYTSCRGVACLSNPGLDTPTFAKNTTIDNHHFACSIGASSTTCVAPNNRGFTISKNGITPAS